MNRRKKKGGSDYYHYYKGQNIFDVLNSTVNEMFKLLDGISQDSKGSKNIISNLDNCVEFFLQSFKSIGPRKLIEMDSSSSILQSGTPNVDSTNITMSILLNFLNCLKHIHEKLKNTQWMILSSKAILEIALEFKQDNVSFIPYYTKTLDYFLLLISLWQSTRTFKLYEIIKIQKEILESLTAPIPISAAQRLLHSDILKLRNLNDKQITKLLLDIYAIFFKSAQNVTVNLMTSTFIEEIKELIESMKLENMRQKDIILHNIVFDILVLQEVQANQTEQFNDILNMIDTVFHPSNTNIIVDYPLLQLSFIRIFSNLMRKKQASIYEISNNEIILRLMSLVSVSYHFKKPLLDMIIDSIQYPGHDSRFLNTNFLVGILDYTGDSLLDIRQKVALIITKIVQKVSLTTQQYELIGNTAFLRIHDKSPKIQREYQNILGLLSPAFHIDVDDSWKFRLLTSIQSTTNLNRTELQHFMNILSKGPSDNINRQNLFDIITPHVLKDIGFSFASKNFKQNNIIKYDKFIKKNLNILYPVPLFLLVTEYAQYIINNKLRVPPKNPNETLSWIESIFTDISSTYGKCLKQSSELNENYNGDADSILNEQSIISRPYIQKSSYLSLSFVDILEKVIFNASYGCLTIPNLTNLGTQSFFVSNRKTCNDWLVSIRPKVLIASSIVNSHYDTIRHGMERLYHLGKMYESQSQGKSDLKSLKKEIEGCLLIVASSFMNIRESDTLYGLKKWADSISSNKLPNEKINTNIFTPLIYESKGWYEKTIKEYEAMLNDEQSKESVSKQFLIDKISNCLVSLCDWEESEKWFTEYSSSNNLSPYNFLKALVSFNKEDYDGTIASLSKIINNVQIDWIDPNINILISDGLVLHAMAKFKLGDKTSLSKYLENAKSLVNTTLFRESLSLTETSRLMAQLHTIKILECEFNNEEKPKSMPHDDIKLNRGVQDIGIWNKILRIRKFCNDEENILPQMLKLSRKQYNVNHASRLIENWAVESPFTVYEKSKILYIRNERVNGVQLLWKTYNDMVEKYNNQEISNIHTRIGLKLARWMKRTKKELVKSNLQFDEDQINTTIESILKNITQNSTQNAKGWFRYADWYYKKGVSHSNEFLSDPIQALPSDIKEELCHILEGKDINEMFYKEVFKHVIEGVDEKVPQDSSREDEVKKIIQNHIDCNDEEIDKLFNIFKKVREALLQPFKESMNAYFNFMNLNGSSSDQTVASLRLLRLFVKYGKDFESEIFEGINNTPGIAWINIVPQLLARLSHPEEIVRFQVLSLLKKIGKESAHVMVYPAIVGAMTESSTIDQFDQQKLYEDLKNSLVEHSPDLVREVGEVLNQLLKITVLWEEKAYYSFKDLQTNIISSARTYEEEISRIKEIEGTSDTEKRKLLFDRYVTIMKPALLKLERFLNFVSRIPETRNEQLFVNIYLPRINSLHELLSNPPYDSDININKVLKLVKGLVSDFSKNKRNIIKLSEISPELYNMKSTNIPMPGLIKKDENITIQSFENTVEILPTKTKPKRIILIGSDGRKYSYLLKGHEDLHLDERVMQFLSYVNLLLNKDNETKDRKMSSRNYAVIPIGTNSGLIQWVDGTIPLYNLYTEWYRRTLETTSQQSQDNVKKAMRPIDMFYSKIIPLVDELGIKNVTSRIEWPVDILKKVFKSLQEETPKNLLEKELWCSSSTTQQWWKKVKQYTISTAVMSIVGYIIGLGDRHLDNILLDFETGEVVHIDYNICFERGLKLRVPEVIPFRLTQNMVQALGITGVEGQFRIACEHVLRVLRGSKETLLTLLEAFVYDPLVDWTSDKNIIEEKALELKIILSLFIDRFESLKQTASQHTVSLTTDLPILLKYSNVIINGKKQYDDLINLMRERQSKKSSLDAKINELNNKLKSLDKECSGIGKSIKKEQRRSDELKTKLEIEYEKYMNEYNEVLDGYSNFMSTNEMDSIFRNATMDPNYKIINLIEGTSSLDLQDRIIRKCKDREKELTQLLTQRDAVTAKTIEHLKTYINFVTQLPSAYMSNTLLSKWLTLLKDIINENFKDIENKVSNFEAEEKTEIQKIQAKEHELSKIITEYSETISELNMKRSMIENERETVEKQVQNHRKKLVYILTKENENSTNSGSLYMQNSSLYCLSDISDQLYTLITLIQSSLSIDFNTEINNLIDRSLFLSQLISDAWFNVEKDKISQYLQPYQFLKKHFVWFKEMREKTTNNLKSIDLNKINQATVSTMLTNLQKLKTSYESMKETFSDENKLAEDIMKWNEVINRIKSFSSSNNLTIIVDILDLCSNLEQKHTETASMTTNQSHLSIAFKFIKITINIILDILQTISNNKVFTDDIVNIIIERYSTLYYESLYIPMFSDCILAYTTKISKTTFALDKPFLSSKDLLPWLKKECPNEAILNKFTSTIKSLIEDQEKLKIISIERSNLISKLTENEKRYQISQIELVGFQWMNEHKLILSKESNTPLIKQKLIADIENSTIALQNLDQAVKKCDEGYTQLEASILKQFNQYVKSNPEHENDQSMFISKCEKRKESFNQIHNKIKDIIKFGKDVQSFEKNYMVHLEDLPLKKNLETYISLGKTITSLEEQLQTQQDKTSKLKQSKENKLAKLHKLKLDIDLDQSLLKKMKDEYGHSRDYIKDPLIKVSEFVESQLSNEADSLISSIIQNTEKWDYVRDIQSLAKKLSKNQKKFKSLLQKLSNLIHFVNRKVNLTQEKEDSSKLQISDLTDLDISSLNEISELQTTIESQIMKLLNLSNEWIQQHEEVQDSDDEDDKMIIPDEVQSTLATSKIVQRVQQQELKNVTAVNILKRIKQKLEGSDNSFMTCISSSTREKRLDVAEQVDHLIKAATDEDNLCRLYEGWSAWI